MQDASHSQDVEATSEAASRAAISVPQVCTAVLLLLAAWLVFNWLETVERMLRYYNPLPVWDYWRIAASLPFYYAHDFRILWHQHNEHRIIFPEIFFAADCLWFHGRQVLPMAISFLCYAGSWLVLAWAFWSNASLSGFVRAVGILLAGIIIGWQGSAVFLMSTFLLQWTLSQLAALLSLAFLSRVKETGSNANLSAAIISAVVATYSSGNGLLLWPILIGAGLLLSIRRQQLLALVIAGILADGLYFIGYRFTGTLSIRKLLEHPVYALEWIGAYLSMPFGAIKAAEFGVWVGITSLAIVIFFVIVAARKHLLFSRAGVVLFGFYLFALVTALLTAAGRIDPNDPTFSSAKPARYLAGPLVTWGVFILLCLWFSDRLRSKVVSPYVVAFVIAVLMLLGLPKLRWWLRGADADNANEQLAALAMKTGLQDPTVELNIFPDPPAVNYWAKGLRENHLSVFYKGLTNWIGRPARSFAIRVDSTVPGEITYTFPVLDGVEVAGWVDGSELRGSTKWILLTNESGEIAGFGTKLPAGFPPVVQNPRTPPSLGWVGFVNLKCPVKQISAYLVKNGSLLAIHGFVPVPPVQVILWPQAGPQIQGLHWQMDPAWTVNGLPPRILRGQGPPGAIYSSWSGTDANAGRITSSIFAAPENACVVLPLIQGPRRGGLSAGIVDADTNQVLASVPFQDTPKQWVFWRLPFAATVKHVRIVAEDSGKQWGEWLAIGNPSFCK
jgi:hypothetical protein